MGKATVYRSFPTTDALVSEVACRPLKTLLERIQTPEGDAITVLERLLVAAAQAKVLGEITVTVSTEATLAHARRRWVAALEAILARADGSVRAERQRGRR